MPFIVKFSYMYKFLNIFTLIIPYCSPSTPDYLLFTPWQAQSASQHAFGSASLTALSPLQDMSTAPPHLQLLHASITAEPVGVHWHACQQCSSQSPRLIQSVHDSASCSGKVRVIWKEEPQLRKCLHQNACRSALTSFFPICGLTFSVLML